MPSTPMSDGTDEKIGGAIRKYLSRGPGYLLPPLLHNPRLLEWVHRKRANDHATFGTARALAQRRAVPGVSAPLGSPVANRSASKFVLRCSSGLRSSRRRRNADDQIGVSTRIIINASGVVRLCNRTVDRTRMSPMPPGSVVVCDVAVRAQLHLSRPMNSAILSEPSVHSKSCESWLP
jgi:hypothetical protein